MLGSARLTFDVDLVVRKGGTMAARRLLREDDAHFKGEFAEGTPVHEVDVVNVLKPTLLLDAKCRSILERATWDAKLKDARDIKFLIRFCVSHGLDVSPEEVPNATKEFAVGFVREHGQPELWEEAGYVISEDGA
ncbi:hypothetical protein SPI_06233 [Niveomyces insectorum RCEF 264]|uniref:Uncharacterized protein n=1 Tax=Niveomyces insectorum RCEF 264 TaxID=1081102 RepID=A0A167RX89_9HYPO|nr:hypothetical protein SPI_06233 [Niveomyces insectorum RCEF 264]